jgi:hypothetical protein
MKLAIRSTVVAAKDLVSCDLAGESIILNINNGMYYGLDPVGSWIWNMIQNPISLQDIRDRLFREYNVEADRGEQDLLALINELADEGLIEVKNGPSA